MTLPSGFTVRPIDPEADLEAVSGLYEACDLVDLGEPDHQEAWIVQTWKSEALQGAWLVHDEQGVAAAYVEVESFHPARSIDAYAPVHPEHRDGPLRPALLAFVTDRAAEAATGPDVALYLAGAANDEGLARDATAGGFRHARTFWHMERAIDPGYDPGDPPDGVTIRPSVDPDDDRAVFEVLDEAFRGHFGIEPMTFERWRADFKDEMYDPSLVLIAMLDARPAGVAANWMPDGLGWVGDLGVRAADRGRGIGAALLRASFAVLAARGATEVRLNVDAENETGATRLYEAVGMTVRRSFHVYETRVSAG